MVRAGRVLGIDHTTVSRRLSALEREIGAVLIERSPRGIAMTPTGLALVGHAERIEAEVYSATSDIAERDAEISGTVRLATPEAFGTYLVAPHIAQLHRRFPRLELELAPESRAVSLSKREADIAIMLRPPERGRLIVRRLIDYRIGLYASHAFLDRAGEITPETLSQHPFVSYIDGLIDMPELRFLDQIAPDAWAPFRSSSISAQHAAVRAGMGIGALHAFAADDDPELRRILPDAVEVRRSYWLVVHNDQQRTPKLRAVIDFLTALVEEQRARF
ncbi:LysR substrate-binding domain-containing protein [soil metagenome]